MNNPRLYPEKPKHRSPLAISVNSWGCALGVLMLAVGLMLGLAASLIFAPQIFGFHVTATALAEQAILLAATDADLDLREEQAVASATLFARDVLATHAALVNDGELLARTATQSAFNIAASATADAAASVRQQTQVALDFEATQAQFQQHATQIELDYRNTQAALDITPAGSSAQAVVRASATMIPTISVTDAPPTRTPVPTRIVIPTATPTPFALDSSFAQGIAQGWNPAGENAWQQSADGIRAGVNGATLFSQASGSGDLDLTITFDPAQVAASDYDIFFGGGTGSGFSFHIRAQGVAASEIGFYSFDALSDGTVPAVDQMMVIVSTRSSQLLRAPAVLRLEVRGLFVSVWLDDTLLLGSDLPQAFDGSVGVRFPQGAVLRRLQMRLP